MGRIDGEGISIFCRLILSSRSYLFRHIQQAVMIREAFDEIFRDTCQADLSPGQGAG